jgi:hypothetical protein
MVRMVLLRLSKSQHSGPAWKRSSLNPSGPTFSSEQP